MKQTTVEKYLVEQTIKFGKIIVIKMKKVRKKSHKQHIKKD